MNQKNGVYILQSIKNQRYYIGSTNNLERRLLEHDRGLVSATKGLRPLALQRFILCPSITDARQAEYRLKKYKSRKIVERVLASGIFPWQYSAMNDEKGA